MPHDEMTTDRARALIEADILDGIRAYREDRKITNQRLTGVLTGAVMRHWPAPPSALPDHEGLGQAMAVVLDAHLLEAQWTTVGNFLGVECSCGDWSSECQEDIGTFPQHVADALLAALDAARKVA